MGVTKCSRCDTLGHHWSECTKPKNAFEQIGFTKEEAEKEINNVEIIPKPQVERTKAWRKKNPEKYRDYMRRYMREYRARGNG